uniref:ANF_receptor domain-containing protein n=1 Tax=Macrostomum lignano TaxID=282301 RepID=A0A1I8I6H0_9PLAT
FGFTSGHDPSNLIDAAVSVLQTRAPDSVVLYYDSNQDSTIVEEAQTKLAANGIGSLTFSVDHLNSSVLVEQMQKFVKNKIRHFLVIAAESTVGTILRSAADTKVMQQNYFWVVLDTGLSEATLLPYAIPNSNIA